MIVTDVVTIYTLPPDLGETVPCDSVTGGCLNREQRTGQKRKRSDSMADEPSGESGEANGGTNGPEGPPPSLFSMALWGPDGPPEQVFRRKDWGLCSEGEGHVDDCSHVSHIRQPVSIPPPEMILSREEMQELAEGYRPIDMNDKWVAFMESDRLFLHRSWTGHGTDTLVPFFGLFPNGGSLID